MARYLEDIVSVLLNPPKVSQVSHVLVNGMNFKMYLLKGIHILK